MKIEREVHGGVAVLNLKGEFDSFVVSAFLEEIESAAAAGQTRVVLDMSGVKFIMSTAIGAVVKARKTLRGMGGDLVVARPSAFVADVLESLGLTRVLSIFGDVAEAVGALGADEVAELPPGNSAILRFETDDEAEEASRPVVARIQDLGDSSMRVVVPLAPARVPPGTRASAKFRLPLFKRSCYFQVPVEVESSEPSDDGTRLHLRFLEIDPEDRAALRQFVADMNYLREEVRRAGEDS